MHYIIFDLEWNQPAVEEAAITDPLYLSGEIIEIGAVKLDEHFAPIDELRLYISPTFYPKMHKRISSLTGIRDKDLLEKGLPFPEAFSAFVQWCGEDFAFMTWSMSDMPILIDNLLIHGIDCSSMPVCYDIQRMFSREILRSSTRFSLDAALAVLREKGDSAHDALHDARNTAKICGHLDLEQFHEEYAAQVFPLPPLSQSYGSMRLALHDPRLSDFACPWCGAEITAEQWAELDSSNFINYGVCPEEGDEFLLQLVLYKQKSDQYRPSRLLYEMSDDFWEIYQDRRSTPSRGATLSQP